MRAAETAASAVRRGRALEFPRDHGAHLAARTEWWYATGWVGSVEQPAYGFQVTFFRSRTGLASDNPSRFAARQLLFAHAAVTDLAARRHHHDQRIARWSGAPLAVLGAAAEGDAEVRLGRWWLRRDGERWLSAIAAAGFKLDLTLLRTQPVLLQGDAGYSRKGPDESQASHYYSEPQLAARARLALSGSAIDAAVSADGRAWIDHEWGDEILHRDAVGWDWIGINLFDGSALTAFVLRRRDGSTLWAGGSFRPAGLPARAFAAGEVRFEPGRRWRSPQTAASYPVQWQVQTPAGRWQLRALMDEQELDSRGSTGTVYWEGLSELLDADGRRVGLGYLEMTGYAGALRL
ncbi:MAG: carotenoid 1,2-hydratase [Rubrivivax sp.]|nr:carotenoid 1,2-hydratase [Rubrivivax sp.]